MDDTLQYDASTREDSLATYEKESSAGVTLRWTPWPWSWVAGGMLLAGLLV